MLTKALQNEGITKVSICTEGYSDVIHQRYRHFCLEQEYGKQLSPVSSVWPNTYPSEIIPQTLYLGGVISAKNEEVLTQLGITHVLNVTDNCACTFEKKCKFSLD